jgi:hypothetical protein
MGLVFQRPLCTVPYANPNGEEVGGKSHRNYQESKDTAELRATGKLVQKDKACEDNEHHSPLRQRISAINLEKHID